MDCACETRRIMTRLNRTTDALIWAGFFLCALILYWRWM